MDIFKSFKKACVGVNALYIALIVVDLASMYIGKVNVVTILAIIGLAILTVIGNINLFKSKHLFKK